mgnify:CR=1 FL=1
MDYFRLVRFFEEYISHYKEFLKFEYTKIDMINKNEIEKLSTLLAAEQALIMKTNSFEGKRLQLLSSNPNLTFAQIVESAPVSCKKRLEKQHKEMSELVFKIKEINDTANVIVTERLKKIQRRTSNLNTYNGLGSVRRERSTNLFAKNI